MPGITLLGLGPGNPAQLTREAWETLTTADEIWLRTRNHPTVPELPVAIKVHAFDDVYEKAVTFEAVYTDITQKVLALGRREQGVLYAVPGHPFIAESTAPEIARLARAEGLQVRVVEGISFLEPTFTALGIDLFPHSTLMDALELGAGYVPAFPVDAPVLITQIYSRMVAAEVKVTLNELYPDHHPVTLVHAAGTKQQVIEKIPLFEIDRSPHIGLLTVLYVEALEKGTSFEAFHEVVAHLRAPDGCPWDREQTHESLRTHLLEETYEALGAIDAGDMSGMAEEFGDLLLQIVLHAQIAHENGDFNIGDVIRGIHEKIVRRHPHVFGGLALDGVDDVLQNWERLKAEERKTNGEPEKGILDGVPLALPSLTRALEYQDRAARVGFDWHTIEGVFEKVIEEIGEIQSAENGDALMAEIGDLFFVLVNFARWKKVDPEAALRLTNDKFKKRFGYIEQQARVQGRTLSDMSLDEMESYWQQAKE